MKSVKSELPRLLGKKGTDPVPPAVFERDPATELYISAVTMPSLLRLHDMKLAL
jgi:hypothetical protein